MKILKDDKVLVLSGKDKLKTGKVLKVFPRLLKVVVEGVNLRKKHTRPKKEGQKGQIIQSPHPLDVSNVKLICPKCAKAARVGYAVSKENKKSRICKKCEVEI